MHIEEVASMIAGRAGTEICLGIRRQEEEAEIRLLRYKYFRAKDYDCHRCSVTKTCVGPSRTLDRYLWLPCLELEQKRNLLSVQDKNLLDQTLRIILQPSDTSD
eukprot:754124-Hanusia_phi.AAC.6